MTLYLLFACLIAFAHVAQSNRAPSPLQIFFAVSNEQMAKLPPLPPSVGVHMVGLQGAVNSLLQAQAAAAKQSFKVASGLAEEMQAGGDDPTRFVMSTMRFLSLALPAPMPMWSKMCQGMCECAEEDHDGHDHGDEDHGDECRTCFAQCVVCMAKTRSESQARTVDMMMAAEGAPAAEKTIGMMVEEEMGEMSEMMMLECDRFAPKPSEEAMQMLLQAVDNVSGILGQEA